MGTVQNIQQYAIMQDALRESEEVYNKLLATIPDPVFRADVEGRIVFVNDVALRISGYAKEELIGKPFLSFLVPEDRPRVLADIKLMFKKSLGPIDYRMIDRKGRVLDIEVNGNVLRNGDGSPFGTLHICRDITARRQAEQELKEWQERYRLLSEASFEGIAITDQGFFLDANGQLLDMLGYTLEEILGRPASDVVAPEWADQVMKNIRESCEEPYEHYLLRKDGSTFPVESRARMMLWRGKKCRVTILKDLTAVKEAEEKRSNLEAQIFQSQKLESLGTLAGGIAHDFNNLLMAIQGYTSLVLLDCKPGQAQHERLKNIEKQVKSGADLTRQLLGFARGGKYEVRPTNMNDLLQENSEMFSRTKREISVYCSFAEDVWAVEVDRGQMEQVFLNMYINAWQAMPAGGNLFIETQNIVLDHHFVRPYGIEPGRYVKISVTDTGTGMDDKTLQRVFEPFFTTKEIGRGYGLGLASAYGIVRNHGGVITAYSQAGYGTAFNVYLPASGKLEAPEEVIPEAMIGGTETIMVVDDDAANIEVISQILIALGYKVITAQNGLAAIELYKKSQGIDLIILDMIMPGLGGGETFDRIKKINPDVRVILSSGYSATGHAKTIIDRGVHAFIQKPFTAEEFSKKIREALSKQEI